VPATLTTSVLDAGDRAIAEQTTSFDAGRFEPARSADYHFDLPLANLAHGEYLLRLDATASNATATRGVRFSVR
jgi:hypothetical protein